MEDRLQPKTAPQCTREPYTAGVLEAPAGYSGQAARTGRTAFMSGPVFGDRSSHLHREGRTVADFGVNVVAAILTVLVVAAVIAGAVGVIVFLIWLYA